MYMNHEIKTYYDRLASDYDRDRFNNSYGVYINNQEKNFVKRILKNIPSTSSLDIACGTGRFLEFADYGIDLSQKMIAEAQKKFPHKDLSCQSASETNFTDNKFEVITCFHLFMHLDKELIKEILLEFNRILKKGGNIIFDVPSKKRRNITSYKANGWHGATSYSTKEIRELTGEDWIIKKKYGIAFFPLHRIPKKLRPLLQRIDTLLSTSIFNEYSSHIIYNLEKK